MKINRITRKDFKDWQMLASQLWPTNSPSEMKKILTDTLSSSKEEGFIARDNAGEAIAFMNLSLRYDYVPGAKRRPIAYLEGIYVKEAYRKQGIATCLIRHAEEWALENHCIELASDALIDNIDSHKFHMNMGFQEVERVVAFVKPIKPTKNNPRCTEK